MLEWLPIESAPKDGARILAWAKVWPWHCIVSWREYYDPGWIIAHDMEFGDCSPTHWMPLPAPPKEKADE